MEKIILAIESSCDETAIAILKGKRELLANIVSSQIDVHQMYGGVVPEIASRLHVENISVVLETALNKAGITMEEVDAIAVTGGPGLVGSLHVGIQAAKTLALMYDLPLINVHHIAGHIYASSLIEDFKFPLLALVVSGGHTELVLMKDDLDYEIIGTTLDDAIGEAYDKVARVLHLPYPGGPQIDRLAIEGEHTYPLPTPLNDDSYNFSFSGLKSAVINLVHNETQRGHTINAANLACSFQNTALNSVVDKTIKCAKALEVKQIIVAGGVAANKQLRQMMSDRALEEGIEAILPPMWCCTDNAAMIASAAHAMLVKGQFSALDIAAKPGKAL